MSQKYIHYHGLLLSSTANSMESLEYAQNFTVEDSDVFAVTFPKSEPQLYEGSLKPSKLNQTRSVHIMETCTSWMQEILPLVLNGGDRTPVKTIPNWDRVPWLENTRLAEIVDQLTSPRAMVTHFPFNLMPPSFHTSKAKVIYVMRDPKDVLVSSYYFYQMAAFLEDPGTFDEFIDTFLDGKVLFGKWTDHVKSWRRAELGDRILFITYEEMVQDLPASIRRISDFLCCNLSEEVIQKVSVCCSFNSMKANPMSNFSLVPKEYMDRDKSPFLRKGTSGSWKTHFSSEQLSRFTSAIKKELEGEKFSLPWSLE